MLPMNTLEKSQFRQVKVQKQTYGYWYQSIKMVDSIRALSSLCKRVHVLLVMVWS